MSEQSSMGHIVWHDLLTTDVGQARQFYGELLGWTYEVEHAEDFVWKPGAADYPLILQGGEAHGGLVAIEPDQQSHWLAFVAVDNVDAAANRSEKLGGTIERTPFVIPGVGRSAVVRDPQGAVICPFVASHSYPAPTGVFLWDELFTMDIAGAQSFYEGVVSGTLAAVGASAIPKDLAIEPQWVPHIAVTDIDAATSKAVTLGARAIAPPDKRTGLGRSALLRDPTGALFAVLQPES
ncbi:MAG: VOC family protein [Pseudomonadota bacterium]